MAYQPKRLTASIEKLGDTLTIQCRRREWSGGCFLLVWLSGWTIGCLALLGLVIVDPRPFYFLFAVPFWAAWGFVSCILLNSFFRVESFRLGQDGAEYQLRVVVSLQNRAVPLKEIKSFGRYTEVSDPENHRTQLGIEMRTDGQTLRFFDRLPDAEQEWLAAQLNNHLSLLREGRGKERIDPPKKPLHGSAAARFESEKLRPTRHRLNPPSDCRWTRIDEFDRLEFFQRGRNKLNKIAGLLFVCLFWNGIVSVFVLGPLLGAIELPADDDNFDMPEGFGWWCLFLFLIPFEIIGFAIFVGLLVNVLQPFFKVSWSFTRSTIDHRTSWFGIGPTRSYMFTSLDCIELRIRDNATESSMEGLRQDDPSEEADNLDERFDLGENPFKLVFIEVGDIVLLEIADLTEGEARWIADVVLCERRQWFT